MIREDYIMKLVKEMIRTMLKLLFDIDTDEPSAELLNEAEKQEYDALTAQIDAGEINEAEDRLYDWVEQQPERADHENARLPILFYAYLNQKSEDYLEEHDFSREEMELGLRSIAGKEGLMSLAETFLNP